jgi:hypothetical protein
MQSYLPGVRIGVSSSRRACPACNLCPRNAALGLGDGNDRVHADKVVLQPKEDSPSTLPIAQRFSSIHTRDVQMSKLHTGVFGAPTLEVPLRLLQWSSLLRVRETSECADLGAGAGAAFNS